MRKAISLWQPWASLIGLGLKQYETRKWRTNYRGKLVICSAKKISKKQKQDYAILSQKYQIDMDWNDLPFGSAIAICDLVDCVEMTNNLIQTISETERDCGDWQKGRYAWKLDNIRVLDNPTPVKGQQGLWNIELDLNPDISPRKIPQRRKKGKGSGYINWRNITKNGKRYKETWFHYELWDKGRQVKSCAYIPKSKRSQIQKMNAEKVPVEEILKVLENRSKRKK